MNETPNVIQDANNVGFIDVPESFFETIDPLTNEPFHEGDEVIVVLHSTPGVPPPELMQLRNVHAFNVPIPEIPNIVTRYTFKRQTFEIYMRHFPNGSDVILPVPPHIRMFIQGLQGSKSPAVHFQIGHLRAIERSEANQVAANDAGRAAFQQAQNERNAALAENNEEENNVEPAPAEPGLFGRVVGTVGNTIRRMIGRGRSRRSLRKKNSRRKHRTHRNRR